tara:strand:+ start:110 stop:358 length:249 start_codon:yes stop_codon:yes gene_type:complete
MIRLNKIFRGTGVDKRFGIDSISTMIELYGSLTHPTFRSLGNKIATKWKNKWFSKTERESSFIMKWIIYKSDPPMTVHQLSG